MISQTHSHVDGSLALGANRSLAPLISNIMYTSLDTAQRKRFR